MVERLPDAIEISEEGFDIEMRWIGVGDGKTSAALVIIN